MIENMSELFLGMLLGAGLCVCVFLFFKAVYVNLVINVRRDIERNNDNKKKYDNMYKEIIIEALSEYERRKNES